MQEKVGVLDFNTIGYMENKSMLQRFKSFEVWMVGLDRISSDGLERSGYGSCVGFEV